MKKIPLQILLALFISLTFTQCNNSAPTLKFHPNDPFKNTIVPSESFEIDASMDNIVSGNEGTTIVCPKGCFKNVKGEIVTGKIKIELAEALALEDMLLSNLTTTSNGQPLETDGMIYFNATANGEQLNINKDIPVHIQIPTEQKKPGMMAYKGTRDKNGNMDWTEPKELDKYLLTVDINSLDFLPEGFRAEVDKGMPYKGYKTSTSELTDSLYFSLDNEAKTPKGVTSPPPQYNEPYYNKNKKVENGKYTDASYNTNTSEIKTNLSIGKDSTPEGNCGVDPLYIKIIKSGKYNNTLITTREFEARLKAIFKACNTQVLELYINNLDKNMYEIDKMAAELLKGTKHEERFLAFAQQGLTKVRNGDKYAKLLHGYFEKQFAKEKTELDIAKNEVLKILERKDEEAKKVADKYKKLLFKREKFRMEKYGFDWTETGWVNIDVGPNPKDWGPQPLQVTIENGNQLERVYTYVIYTSIKSLYRLNTSDNREFYAGNEEDKEMLMPKKEKAVTIAIGYKGKQPYLAVKEFETGSEPKFSLTLTISSIEKVKEAVGTYEKYAKENKMSVDLEYMAKFHEEEQRQKDLMMESLFLQRLWNKAYPCCADAINGKRLFVANCSSCHSIYAKLVGPALAGITSKRSSEWLYQFTRNNEKLRESGDALAIKVYNEHGKAAMNLFENLSREEIDAIYKYIDEYGKYSQ